MAATATPYGFRVVDNSTYDGASSGKIKRFVISTNTANAIIKGNLLTISTAGVVDRITASPVPGVRTGAILGVCIGFEYDTSAGNHYIGPYLPANAITGGATYLGVAGVAVDVCIDRNVILQVQADGSIAASALYNGIAIGSFASDTALSAKNVATGSASSSNPLALKIVGFASTAGDAYTDLLVTYAAGTHINDFNPNTSVQLQRTVSLTNTQTKALNTVPTEIVPAPGASSVIVIDHCFLQNNYSTAAFANGGVIQLSYGAGVTTPASATVAATFLTSPTADQVIVLAGALATNLASAVSNVAVNIACASADFITGSGNLEVTVSYRVITLA